MARVGGVHWPLGRTYCWSGAGIRAESSRVSLRIGGPGCPGWTITGLGPSSAKGSIATDAPGGSLSDGLPPSARGLPDGGVDVSVAAREGGATSPRTSADAGVGTRLGIFLSGKGPGLTDAGWATFSLSSQSDPPQSKASAPATASTTQVVARMTASYPIKDPEPTSGDHASPAESVTFFSSICALSDQDNHGCARRSNDALNGCASSNRRMAW